MQTKVCTKCGEEKALSEFSRDKYKKSGYKSCCLACDKISNLRWRASRPEYPKEYRAANPQIFRDAVKRWRDRNPEKVKEIEANRAPRDPEQRRAYNQEYWVANKERLSEYNKAYYSDNAEAMRAYALAYREANPHVQKAWIEANREHIREQERQRRATPKGTIDGRMSSGIRQALVDGKGGRSWEALVGYTLDDLMAHLESLFVDGMSWENRSEWHIDHIIPKSIFNYTSPEHIDFKRCWSLGNLQPLWAGDNVRKGAKYDLPFQPSLALG